MDRPDTPAKRPEHVARYRRLLYGFVKAAAVIEEGVKDAPAPKRRARPAERRTPAGIVLPGSAGDELAERPLPGAPTAGTDPPR